MKLKIKIFLHSLLLFLAVFWTMLLSIEECIWIETVVFFLFSWYETNKHMDVLRPITILGFVLLGRLILEVPVRVMDFMDSIGTLVVTISNIVAILLGYWNGKFKDVKLQRIIISIIILIIVNIIDLHPLLDFFDAIRKV